MTTLLVVETGWGAPDKTHPTDRTTQQENKEEFNSSLYPKYNDSFYINID